MLRVVALLKFNTLQHKVSGTILGVAQSDFES